MSDLEAFIQSIVKTPEELAAENTGTEPACKTRNAFTKEEAAHKRNIRQMYPEYYRLYSRRSRLLHNLKKSNIKPDKLEEYRSALTEVETELKMCQNKPKRSKFSL